eukprot:1160243-Amphidinium_carterae.1
MGKNDRFAIESLPAHENAKLYQLGFGKTGTSNLAYAVVEYDVLHRVKLFLTESSRRLEGTLLMWIAPALRYSFLHDAEEV